MSEVTIQEFDDKLEGHDWTYQESDDGSVYRRGSAAEQKLLEMAKLSLKHAQLLRAWIDFCGHGSIITKVAGIRHPIDRDALTAIRVELGAKTQAHFDSLKADEVQRKRDEEIRGQKSAVEYDKLCLSFDPMYWKHDAHSVHFKEGQEKNTSIRRDHIYWPGSQHKRALYEAWSKFWAGKSSLEELNTVRAEIGLGPFQ